MGTQDRTRAEGTGDLASNTRDASVPAENEDPVVACGPKVSKLTVKVVYADDETKFYGGANIRFAVIEPGEAQPQKSTRDDEALVIENIVQGKYKVSLVVTEEDRAKFKLPDGETPEENVTIGEQEAEVVFKVIPIIRIHLKLQFNDPEGGPPRPFPAKFPLQILLEGDETIDAVIGDKGLLNDKEGEDAKAYIELERKKQWFKLAFKQPKRSFIVCEKAGPGEKKQEYVQVDDPFTDNNEIKTAIEDEKRFFMLPMGDWTWDNADWHITDAPVYNEHKFEDLEDTSKNAGTKDTPMVLTLEPHWQYMKFVYFDRYFGNSADHGGKQISTRPLCLEGYGEDMTGEANPALDKLTTFSNWTFGNDNKSLCQAVPWIVRREDNGNALVYPGAKSMVRFRTDNDHRFIKSKTAADREFCKLDATHADKHHLPCSDRLRYYDLPAEWRSTGYFGRISDAAEDMDFWNHLVFKKTSKDYPIIFSLDDMVMTKADLKPIAWNWQSPEDAANPNDRVALFVNSFKGTGWDSPIPAAGVAPGPVNIPDLPEADSAKGKPAAPATPARLPILPEKPGGPTPKDKQYLSPSGLYKHGYRHTDKKADFTVLDVKSNYIADYPDWTRVVFAQGCPFDAFEKRTVFDSANSLNPAGARAAVRWVNCATAADGGVGVAAGNNRNALAVLVESDDHRFFSIQPYMQFKFFAQKKSPAGTAHYDEWNSPRAANAAGIFTNTRSDWLLLRCCDHDGNDEHMVNMRYYRMNYDFSTERNDLGDNIPIGPPVYSADIAVRKEKRKEWVRTFHTTCADRWNGNDAINNSVPIIEQRDGNPKLKARIINFLQELPSAIAHYKVTLLAETEGSSMSSGRGTGKLRVKAGFQEPPPHGGGLGRGFAGAHEIGHTHGQPDDYSPGGVLSPNLGFQYNHMPGSPFVQDTHAMMKFNRYVHTRYYWPIAEWIRTLKKNGLDTIPFVVKHDGNTYEIPHYPHDDRPGRHFAYWPVMAKVEYADNGAFYDSYLYMVGKDQFSNDGILQTYSGIGGYIDGLLIIELRTKITFSDSPPFVNAALKKNLVNKLTKKIEDNINKKVTAEFELLQLAQDPKGDFSNCYIHVAARFDDANDGHLNFDIHFDEEFENENWGGTPREYVFPAKNEVINDMGDWNTFGDKVATTYFEKVCKILEMSHDPLQANAYDNPDAYKPIIKAVTNNNAVNVAVNR